MQYFFTYGYDFNILELFITTESITDKKRRQQALFNRHTRGAYGPFEAEDTAGAALHAQRVLESISQREPRVSESENI